MKRESILDNLPVRQSGRKKRSRSSVRTTIIIDKEEEQKLPIEKLTVFENLVKGITPVIDLDESDNSDKPRSKPEECMNDYESKKTGNMAGFQQVSFESSAVCQMMRNRPKNLCQTKIAVKSTQHEKDGRV